MDTNKEFVFFRSSFLVMSVLCFVCSISTNDVIYRPEEGDRCNKTVDIYQAISSPPVTEQNRNQPLHCTYRIRVRPPRNDWVVFVRFTRMRVGEPSEDRQTCLGGYIQIIDGYRDSNHSNKDAPGSYCGEIDSPKTFVSETPHVKIVLHVDAYDVDSFLQFDANVEQQQEVHARYGQYAQLYPHRRGTLVHGTYCERWYHSCAPTRCFVQSPGYPGIYPRNLKCRYHLKVSQSEIALDLNTFDVDGLRCDNLLLCFPRPITREPKDCPFDYVRIFDGATDDSPLIITLCGRGRLKSQIVASGSDMLLEFVSSPAGPLLNTGFHFKAESVYGESETEFEALHLGNGTCSIEKNLKDVQQATFASLRSWYPPNTTCTYRFLAAPEEILRLTFEFFRSERVTLCDESLKLYDASFADPSKIMVKLCDINKPRTEQPKSVYESTGSALFVEFHSKIGSLEGSSLSYAFVVKLVNVAADRNRRLNQNTCDRSFYPEKVLNGVLITTYDDVNSSSVASSQSGVTCNYTFDASVLRQGRVNITLYVSLRKVDDCEECRREPIRIETVFGPVPKICFCKTSSLRRYSLSSLGPQISLSLHVDPVTWDRRFHQKQVLNASYNFFSETRCGAERLKLDVQGMVTYPPVSNPECENSYCLDRPVFCSWKIPVFHRMDIAFRVTGLASMSNCSSDNLAIERVLVCPTTGNEQEVVIHKEDIDSDVTVSLRATSALDALNVTVKWTQLRILPNQQSSNSDVLVSLGKDCDFLCTNSMACLTRELVCNGVANCPGVLNNGQPADEDQKLCVAEQDVLGFYWWIVGLGVASGVLIVLCLVFAISRRCRHRRHRF